MKTFLITILQDLKKNNIKEGISPKQQISKPYVSNDQSLISIIKHAVNPFMCGIKNSRKTRSELRLLMYWLLVISSRYNTACKILNWLWVRSPRCNSLVIWFCYQLIAKIGNKTAAPPWPDPLFRPYSEVNFNNQYDLIYWYKYVHLYFFKTIHHLKG